MQVLVHLFGRTFCSFYQIMPAPECCGFLSIGVGIVNLVKCCLERVIILNQNSLFLAICTYKFVIMFTDGFDTGTLEVNPTANMTPYCGADF